MIVPPDWRHRGAVSRELAAKILGFSLKIIDGLVRDGKLRACPGGRRVAITVSSILRHLGDAEPGIAPAPAAPAARPERPALPVLSQREQRALNRALRRLG